MTQKKERFSWFITRTRIHKHNHSIQWAYSLLLRGDNDYAKAPKCLFLRTLLVFLILRKNYNSKLQTPTQSDVARIKWMCLSTVVQNLSRERNNRRFLAFSDFDLSKQRSVLNIYTLQHDVMLLPRNLRPLLLFNAGAYRRKKKNLYLHCCNSFQFKISFVVLLLS